MKDYWASSTTGAGASDGTTVVDTALGRYGDDALRGFYVRLTGAGGTQYQVRRVWRSTGSSGTLEVLPAFSAQVGSAVTYELHRYDPASKFLSLDEARLLVYPELAKFVYSTTLPRLMGCPPTTPSPPLSVRGLRSYSLRLACPVR
jgi:hypothetical protein